MLIGLSFPHIAQAQTPAQLTSSTPYFNCTASKSGGKTTFKFRAQLVNGLEFVMQQNEPQTAFSTWGTIVFFYDANGNLKPTPGEVNVKMNNAIHQNRYAYPLYPSTPLFSGPYAYGIWPEFSSSWHKYVGGINNFEIVVNSSDIAEYPTIAVAIVVHGTFPAGQSIGKAWIDNNAVLLTENQTAGMCTQIAPGTKPPEAKKASLTINVPDWDFGELGTSIKPTLEPICFSDYTTDIYSERLQMHVSNQNGTTGGSPNMFKLMHTSDPTATIPYSLTVSVPLITSFEHYDLPRNTPMPIAPTTFLAPPSCYAVNFTTQTTTASKPGDYMDTLTFTVSNIP